MRKSSVILMLVMIFSLSSCSCKKEKEQELRESFNSIPMLYTVEAVTQVYVESMDSEESLMRYFGSRNIIVPVSANVKAGIDLSKMEDIKIEGNTVYVTLPDPEIEIESSRIVYSGIVSNVTGLRQGFSDEEITAISQAGREKIEKNLDNLGLIEPAQKQAEAAITAIVEKAGMNVVFKKRPVYREKELIQLVKENE